ncbi:MAG: hypothetical protein ACUVRK_02730 [Spirochaetota bacterium]
MSTYFTHPRLGNEVESIAGVYAYTQEKRLQIQGRDVLYFVGYSVANKSCCGVGGCMFATVAGFVQRYAVNKDNDTIVSEVEPITDVTLQHHIERLIKTQGIMQVNFSD